MDDKRSGQAMTTDSQGFSDADPERPMVFAYADPPYLGVAERYYAKHHPEAAVYDDPETHRTLLERLSDEYPDGWAYSLSSVSLKTLLPMVPDDVRVMAWVKPFHAWRKGVNPSYAWEPVFVRGGRRRDLDADSTRLKLGYKDFVSANITLQKGLAGAKPPEFCFWLFEVLNALPGDTFDDLFPGTGIVGRCWDDFSSRARPVQEGMLA